MIEIFSEVEVVACWLRGKDENIVDGVRFLEEVIASDRRESVRFWPELEGTRLIFNQSEKVVRASYLLRTVVYQVSIV